mmetsp:Transcript_22609/g.63797  ORF Transcript_22609/g.63797 Transcript_22609/m.63797 type:complete len:360 (-) Transcript_22609:661-1740(-)
MNSSLSIFASTQWMPTPDNASIIWGTGVSKHWRGSGLLPDRISAAAQKPIVSPTPFKLLSAADASSSRNLAKKRCGASALSFTSRSCLPTNKANSKMACWPWANCSRRSGKSTDIEELASSTTSSKAPRLTRNTSERSFQSVRTSSGSGSVEWCWPGRYIFNLTVPVKSTTAPLQRTEAMSDVEAPCFVPRFVKEHLRYVITRGAVIELGRPLEIVPQTPNVCAATKPRVTPLDRLRLMSSRFNALSRPDRLPSDAFSGTMILRPGWSLIVGAVWTHKTPPARRPRMVGRSFKFDAMCSATALCMASSTSLKPAWLYFQVNDVSKADASGTKAAWSCAGFSSSAAFLNFAHCGTTARSS